MTRTSSKCNGCQIEYELELIGFNFWERRKSPSTYNCPNCSAKYYIREPQWLKSLTWSGIKIIKRHNQKQINTKGNAFNVDLDANEVHRILTKKRVIHLHHANTVTTSKSFLENKALLSREFIESQNLFQTGQDSDDKDRKFDIHNFVFLDGKDLASYFSQPNHYGPILFKMNLDLLLSEEIPTVRITRRNPIYWHETNALNEQYYNNLEEFENEYLTGNKLADGNMMFMITTTKGQLSLEDYLQEISVDNPNLIFSDNTTLLNKISSFLKPELNQLGIQLKVLNRFRFSYNFMRLRKFEKYKKFFTTKRE